MSVTIPEGEPLTIVAGDYLQWYKMDLGGYPSSEYSLKYVIYNTSKSYEVIAGVHGSGYLITITIATSADYVAGNYRWDAYISKTGVRYKVDTGYLTIKTDTGALAAGAGYDYSTDIKKIYDAIEAVILGRASKDQESFTIAGRTLSRTPVAELIKLRNFYKSELQNELNAEAIDLGDAPKGKIRVRFVEPK